MMKYSQYSETLFDEDWNMDIPQSWDKVALKRLCKVSSGSTPKGQPEFWNGEIKWVTPDDLGKNNSKTIFLTNRTITDDGYESCGTELIPKGSVVLSTRAPIGHTALIEDDMCFNQGCKGLTPNEKVDSSFLYYLIIASKEKLQVLGNGTTFIELSRVAFASYKGIFPSLPEQTQIASFLDKKTAQIDKLINEKEKLLKLLAEKRTAIITQAVTGKIKLSELGLSRIKDKRIEKNKSGKSNNPANPNADKWEMKDSGIDWLGEIPKHWDTLKLRYLGRMKSGETITSLEIKKEGEYPVYGGNGLRGYYDSYTHEGEYILIGRQGALCGNINFARGKFWATEHAVVLTVSDKVNLFWLGELLRIMNLNQYSVSAAQPGLAIDKIQNLYVPLPPLDEQICISQFLKNKSLQSAVDSKIQESINQLKEYREALITAAVTGQIKV